MTCRAYSRWRLGLFTAGRVIDQKLTVLQATVRGWIGKNRFKLVSSHTVACMCSWPADLIGRDDPATDETRSGGSGGSRTGVRLAARVLARACRTHSNPGGLRYSFLHQPYSAVENAASEYFRSDYCSLGGVDGL